MITKFNAMIAAVLAFGLSGAAVAADGLYFSAGYGAGLQTEEFDFRSDATVLNAALGYDFGAVRVEGEYLRSADTGYSYGENVAVNALNANVVLEYENDTIFTPFVKAGAGYAFVDNGFYGDDAGLLLNVGAGVSVDVTDNLDITAEYRYITSDVDVVGDYGYSDFDQHVVSVGLVFDL